MRGNGRSGSIISTARVNVLPGKRKELLLTISPLIDLIRREEGCHGYWFYRDADEDNAYLLIGEWDTPTDWDRHMHSEHFAVLLGTMGVLGDGGKLDFTVSSLIGELEALTEKKTRRSLVQPRFYDSNERASFPPSNGGRTLQH